MNSFHVCLALGFILDKAGAMRRVELYFNEG